jgi:sporulation protein YlmC with PRC-barrel domain
MSQATEFTIGSEVLCSDGECGELQRVVVDPVARALTHLVVEARYRQGNGHLVPIDLVDSAGDTIRLKCSTVEFQQLDDAEETQFIQGAPGQWGYGQGQMMSLPLFALGGMGGMGMGGMGMGGLGMGGGMFGGGMMGGGMGMRGMGQQATIRDRVPVGEVEIRRGEHVHASDGDIGRVKGFAIDPSDYHVTHILLDEGHLWGTKEVAVPISAVSDVKDGVSLNLSKDQVRDLPPVEVDQHH